MKNPTIEIDDFEPALCGLWPDSAAGWSDTQAKQAAETFFLERKSAEHASADELRVLLNEMTAELRDEFVAFRQLRKGAELAAEEGDDAAAKLARADLKAAADAMSLIVRTLEKVDALQRQLLQDRELQAEQAISVADIAEAKVRFLKQIEERAHEEARLLFDEWKSGRGPPAIPGDGGGATAPSSAEPVFSTETGVLSTPC